MIYYDTNEIEPLADNLVEVFSRFLSKKGIMLINEEMDIHQYASRSAIYGEDFRILQELVQNELNKHTVEERV